MPDSVQIPPRPLPRHSGQSSARTGLITHITANRCPIIRLIIRFPLLFTAESVPRAVASEAPSICILMEPRSLPLAVLIRRELTFQCNHLSRLRSPNHITRFAVRESFLEFRLEIFHKAVDILQAVGVDCLHPEF